jgi:hypothetical protein
MVFNNPTVLLEKLGVKSEYQTKLAREKLLEAGWDFIETWEGPLASIARKVLGLKKEKEEKKEEKQ